MILKILFTLAIIVGVVIYMRHKAASPVVRNSVHKQTTKQTQGQKMFRQGAYLFLLFMFLSAVMILYSNYTEQSATVLVNVINTKTGNVQTYKAEHKSISSQQFTTLDGRRIYVAEVERLEIEPQK